jgi:hypothetical protein
MNKAHAIKLLGGTVTAAAKAIGISASAVTQWPDELPDRIADRVLAAYVRQTSPEVLGDAAATQTSAEKAA